MSKSLTLVVTNKELTPEDKSKLLLEDASVDSVKRFDMNLENFSQVTQLMVVFSPEIEEDTRIATILGQLKRKIKEIDTDLDILILRWVDDDFKTLNTSDLSNVQKLPKNMKVPAKTLSWLFTIDPTLSSVIGYKCISLEGPPHNYHDPTSISINLTKKTKRVEIHNSRVKILNLESAVCPSKLGSVKLNGNHEITQIIVHDFYDTNSNDSQNVCKLGIEFENCSLEETERRIIGGLLSIKLKNTEIIHSPKRCSCCCSI